MISFSEQLRPPNYVGEDGNFYLIRCFNCSGEYGIENYLPAVASGVCAWCGWSKEKAEETNDKEKI